ncbi:hypothetical protein CANARDRAFT_22887 [[Candida] arabinofermentans NRRL YB-2248]|uniref:GOLD domain-containing protein n=1 Tax=[Candida] arabinofermentans NRRL YB-2248 TaxID=983967 RepID=A0A1E4T0T9_9ASCO|nr:hypothetical protein CANARDRAFT_22887 [[Candida] arabinofermentans NRRL YB-2248]
MESINKHQNELNLKKVNNKKKLLIEDKLNQVINEYISSNNCYRYHIRDYINYNDIKSESDNDNVLIALTIEFENLPNNKIQQISLNIIDKHGNIMRRKNNLFESKIHMIIDLPYQKQDFLTEYFDICFENIKIDQSWKTIPLRVDAYMNIQFGIPEIVKQYKLQTQGLYNSKSELIKLESVIDSISIGYINSIEVEKNFRNLNEDTLFTGTILYFSCILVILITSVSQLIWLHNYLKSNGLL